MRISFKHKSPKALLEKTNSRLPLILFFISLLFALDAAKARAFDQPPTPPSQTQNYEGTSIKITRDARGRKVQTLDFSDAIIEGKARTPEGVVIQARKTGRFRSLIEFRNHFRDNIKVDAEESFLSPSSAHSR